MAVITPGVEGTLESLTAEAAFVELLSFLRLNEALSAKNPTNKRYVNINYNANTGFVDISWTIPATISITDSGVIQTLAADYLSNVAFSSGTAGTFKSANYAQAVLEIAEYIQLLEADSSKNPNDLNYIQSNYDSDTKNHSGTAQIPFQIEIDNGSPRVKVLPYLN